MIERLKFPIISQMGKTNFVRLELANETKQLVQCTQTSSLKTGTRLSVFSCTDYRYRNASFMLLSKVLPTEKISPVCLCSSVKVFCILLLQLLKKKLYTIICNH